MKLPVAEAQLRSGASLSLLFPRPDLCFPQAFCLLLTGWPRGHGAYLDWQGSISVTWTVPSL